MIKIIIKIAIIFQLIIIPIKAIAAPAGTEDMYIDSIDINQEIKNYDYPVLIKSFDVKQSLKMITLKGNLNGLTMDVTSSYIRSLKPYTKAINGNAIFPFDGTSDYGFAIQIQPAYDPGNGNLFFKEKYFSTRDQYFYMNSNESQPGNGFRAIFLGARIKIDIYALKRPSISITSIKEQKIAYFYARGKSGQIVSSGTSNIFINGFNINSSPTTCKITSSNPHVINMPEIKIGSFSTSNEISGGSPANIILTCSSGVNTVKAGMSDITEPNNTSTELVLEPSSTAIGIGIRLYHDGTEIIKYNPNTTTDTWTLIPENSTYNGDTIYNVPISAKYYKNKKVISPGTISAKAKITFIYN